jgi:hypothetical protein
MLQQNKFITYVDHTHSRLQFKFRTKNKLYSTKELQIANTLRNKGRELNARQVFRFISLNLLSK